MNSVQILEKAVSISLHANALKKSKNPSLLKLNRSTDRVLKFGYGNQFRRRSQNSIQLNSV